MPSAGETCHTTGMDIPNTGGGGRRSPPVDLETCVGGGLGALASGCTMGQIRLAKQVDVDQRAVGGMIASGHCDDALNYALKNGKLDLAERVSGICRNIAAMPAKP